MLTEEQQNQYVAFVANFLSLLHEETNVTKEQAEALLSLAVSVLLGAIFNMLSPTGEDDPLVMFAAATMKIALDREYATEKVVD